ncbi:MAG: hypothetical protein KF764_00240 [Labilithrix sp.]|nr:hypothetical protein [Labilithrix sp.]
MPPRSTARSKTSEATANAKPVSVPDSLILRSYSWFRFVKVGWAKQKRFTDAFIDAFARTAVWEHLPLLSIGGAAAKPRGSGSALKTAFASGKSRYALLAGGKTIYSDETTAFIELVISPAGADITTAARGSILATLGVRALDDVFTMMRSLHDDLDGAAHVVAGNAWTDWDDNAPSSKLSSDWPLRAIADVLEPARPKQDEDDVFWDAAKAIAKAKPPAGVVRKTHGGLVTLRWTADPRDARAANAAALGHEAWLRDLVDTVPM